MWNVPTYSACSVVMARRVKWRPSDSLTPASGGPSDAVASHTSSHFTARFVSHWVTVDRLRAVWQ